MKIKNRELRKIAVNGVVERFQTRLALTRDDRDFRRVWSYFTEKIIEQIV